ncbi:MAG: DUF5659 domain-containing protein [Patescibacteria group bacterium]
MKINIERYFKTTNFNLASFLFVKGIELANIDRLDNQKRQTFVFVENPQTEELIHEFDYAKENDEIVMVDARKLIYATKQLKDKLYQTNY